jgi:hypothetical protein
MKPASRLRAAPNRLEENSLPAFSDPILFRDFGPTMLACVVSSPSSAVAFWSS